MEILQDPAALRACLSTAIAKYGHAPEHNLEWFICYGLPGTFVPTALAFPDGTAIMAHCEADKWTFFSEPLAPEDRRGERLAEAINTLLADPACKKVTVELSQQTRRQLLEHLPERLRARSVNFTLMWPYTDLATFDPTLPGGKWKTIRKERNGFYAEHAVEVVPATSVPAASLHAVLDAWSKHRPPRDRTYDYYYHTLIDRGFVGTESARAFIVDGKPEGLNAGWMIPNSNIYYGSIGVHSYAHQDLGDMIYLEDLEWLKRNGYMAADMGGMEKGSSMFKKKFFPTSWYKTFTFSVGRA